MRVGLALAVACTFAGALPAQGSGTLVVVNRSDGTVSLVDLASKAITATIPVGSGPHEAAVSPNGALALVSNFGPATAAGVTVTLIDIAAGAEVRTIALGRHRRPDGIVWLADGKRALVAAASDSAVLVVDAERGVIAEIPTGQSGSHLLALSSDGAHAYVTNIGSSSVTMLDLAARRAVKSIPIPQVAEGIALRPDGAELWVSSPVANRITVLAAADLSVLGTIVSEDYPLRIHFTPDGKLALVTLAKSSQLKIYDVATRKEVAAIAMRIPIAMEHGATASEGWDSKTVPIGVTVSPDGTWGFVANAGSEGVTVVAIAKREVAAIIFVGREPVGVAWSPLVRNPSP
jgi:YVTN family beta-propeller protein